MDILECIKTRRTVRKYRETPVEWEKVGQILDAGRSAPSSGNLQNWKFIVVTNADARKNITDCCANQVWMEKAPVHIIITGDHDKGQRFFGVRGDRLYTIQNCAAAAQNMLLMGHALGLGSAWIGYFDEEKIRELHTIPPELRPHAILVFGYADEVPPTPPKYTLENVMYFRQFGGQPNRIKDIPLYQGNLSYKLKDGIDWAKDKVKKVNDKLIGKDDDE